MPPKRIEKASTNPKKEGKTNERNGKSYDSDSSEIFVRVRPYRSNTTDSNTTVNRFNQQHQSQQKPTLVVSPLMSSPLMLSPLVSSSSQTTSIKTHTTPREEKKNLKRAPAKPRRKKTKPITEVEEEEQSKIDTEFTKTTTSISTENDSPSGKSTKNGGRKEAIPATVRNVVWVTYVGNAQNPLCFCCAVEPITRGNFQCGHVIAESKGGQVVIENLRPICSLCNTSMGTHNMEEFMAKYHFRKCAHWEGYQTLSKSSSISSKRQSGLSSSSTSTLQDHSERCNIM